MSSMPHAVKLDIGRFIRNIAHSLNRMSTHEDHGETAVCDLPAETKFERVSEVESLSGEAREKFTEKLKALLDAENDAVTGAFEMTGELYTVELPREEERYWPTFCATDQQRRAHRLRQDRKTFDAIISKLKKEQMPLSTSPSRPAAAEPERVKTAVATAVTVKAPGVQTRAEAKRAQRKSGILNKIEDAWNHRLSVL